MKHAQEIASADTKSREREQTPTSVLQHVATLRTVVNKGHVGTILKSRPETLQQK